jgi:hypothetical protein
MPKRPVQFGEDYCISGLVQIRLSGFAIRDGGIIEKARMTFPVISPFLPLKRRREAEALLTTLAAMNVDAAMTIAFRLPIFAHAAMGDATARRETEKALSEKLAAITETGTVATLAAASLWWEMALTPLTYRGTSEALARATRKTLRPISRATRANRRRLSSTAATH